MVAESATSGRGQALTERADVRVWTIAMTFIVFAALVAAITAVDRKSVV